MDGWTLPRWNYQSSMLLALISYNNFPCHPCHRACPHAHDHMMSCYYGVGGAAQLYLCELAGVGNVLVRVFGLKTEEVIDRDRENIVVNYLSGQRFGPRIFGRGELCFDITHSIIAVIPCRTIHPSFFLVLSQCKSK
jgi:hypothetical protein